MFLRCFFFWAGSSSFFVTFYSLAFYSYFLTFLNYPSYFNFLNSVFRYLIIDPSLVILLEKLSLNTLHFLCILIKLCVDGLFWRIFLNITLTLSIKTFLFSFHLIVVFVTILIKYVRIDSIRSFVSALVTIDSFKLSL